MKVPESGGKNVGSCGSSELTNLLHMVARWQTLSQDGFAQL